MVSILSVIKSGIQTGSVIPNLDQLYADHNISLRPVPIPVQLFDCRQTTF
jgi:hypothetical protein